MVLLIVGVTFFCTFCITGYLLLDYYAESLKQRKLNEQLAEMRAGTWENYFLKESEEQSDDGSPFNEDSEFIYVKAEIYEPVTTKQPDAETGTPQESEVIEEPVKAVLDFSSINPDYIGWIQIPGTEINNPVVQRDNSYYLTHDFMGENSKHGTIFLDEKCRVEDQFLLIHGHHMKDGTMFGSLKSFKKADYRKEHSQMVWSVEEEVAYRIFAGAQIDLLDPNHFYYGDLPQTAAEIPDYLEQLKATAFWYDEIEWAEDSHFVILSTCDYGSEDERLIIVAVEEKN